MKIAVIGANGQLGTDVAKAMEANGYTTSRLTHSDIEISDEASVAATLGELRPKAVINTAAFHNVDHCERQPMQAFAVNALGVRNLARYCAGAGVYLLHVSTDYVFDGVKRAPYVETDYALPLNTYGNSKLAGEHYVRTICPTAAIMRVSGVYGANPCRAKSGLNFVSLMLKLAGERTEIRVVDDEILTPTYAVDIARQAVELVKCHAPGLFHATAQGSCSWYEFARYVFDKSATSVNLQKALPDEFPAKVARPSYSVLDNASLRSIGLDVMPSWQDGLERYLAEAGIGFNTV
jgi:dTDP-4-dehydrorhamnose reductase